MKARKWFIAGCGLVLTGFGAWSMGLSQVGPQEKPIAPPPPLAKPPELQPPVAKPFEPRPAEPRPSQRDLSKVSLLEKHAYLSCQRGADWLQRVNRPDGRFIFGYLPALRAPMEGDQFLHQAQAALALARTGRSFRDDKAMAIAKQALLTLLLETAVDPKADDVRFTNAPSALVNRLASAGLLILAIQELPAADKDLLAQAAQLGNFIKRQQRGDGALSYADPDGTKPGPDDAVLFSGPALAALMRGDLGAPAAWKLEIVRKAHAFYAKAWSRNKSFAMVRWHTLAYTDAFRATKQQTFADSVFAMNDWLCDRQHQDLDPRNPLRLGGFKGLIDGNDRAEPPEVSAAAYLESLVEACRTARLAGDVRRWQRYRQAAERTVQFLTTLQYTDASTQHFAEWYRPVLVGGFHRSHQDGDLRLDFTAEAVAALASYVTWAAEQPVN